MRISLQRRLFTYLVFLLATFIVIQTGIYTWVEYHGWINHPTEPLQDELEEVRDALLLNLALLPIILILAWRVSYRMLAPVRSIAGTAKRIGDGHFDERIDTALMADDEMHKLADAINQAFERYDSAVQRLKRFTGDVSHQLRTPLAALRTLGEVAASRERPATEYRETISSMLQELDRLHSFIEQLLALSRLEHGAFTGRFKIIDAETVMIDAVRLYEPVCEENGVHLDSTGMSGLFIHAVPELLTEMLGNLIDNAVRHTPCGGSIRVGCLRRDDAAILFVHDTGPGIAEDQAARVFDRFFQIPGRSNGGAGLGLAISREITSLHRGTLQLVNPGQSGARFEASLPLANASLHAPSAPALCEPL